MTKDEVFAKIKELIEHRKCGHHEIKCDEIITQNEINDWIERITHIHEESDVGCRVIREGMSMFLLCVTTCSVESLVMINMQKAH